MLGYVRGYVGDFGEFWDPPVDIPVENVPGPTSSSIQRLKGVWYGMIRHTMVC